MSFVNGIVDGIGHALGLSSSHHEPAKRRSEQRPANAQGAARRPGAAASTSTGYDGAGAPTGAAASPALPTLLDRLAATRSDARPAGPAHELASGDDTSRDPLGSLVDQALAGQSTAASTAAPRATARVFDAAQPDAAGSSRYVGDAPQLTSGAARASSSAVTAARNVQRGLDYYASTFGRAGLDGAGSGVDVVINDRSTDDAGRETFRGNGGYYATPQVDGTSYEAIRFGSGTSYQGPQGLVAQSEMLNADDLAIHELTHGIIRKETGYLGGHEDEAGATNEAIADVMAASATRDWRLGEGMYTAQSHYRSMRNIADPGDPTAVHGLWTSMSEVRAHQARGEGVEEHWASGVLSTAAYRIQQRIGGEAGWKAVERVFYDTIDQDRLGDMSFTAVATGLRRSAAASLGARSAQYAVVDQELRRAGL